MAANPSIPNVTNIAHFYSSNQYNKTIIKTVIRVVVILRMFIASLYLPVLSKKSPRRMAPNTPEKSKSRDARANSVGEY